MGKRRRKKRGVGVNRRGKSMTKRRIKEGMTGNM